MKAVTVRIAVKTIEPSPPASPPVHCRPRYKCCATPYQGLQPESTRLNVSWEAERRCTREIGLGTPQSIYHLYSTIFTMSILLTGGTGKTSTRLAKLLDTANVPFLLTSRRGPDAASEYPIVEFDWTDETTWPKLLDNGRIDAVYMMEPQVAQPWVPMIKFVDFAKEKGVKRFVLCAGTSAAVGKDGMGKVWEHYIKSGVEYCVLRPSWFMGQYFKPHVVLRFDSAADEVVVTQRTCWSLALCTQSASCRRYSPLAKTDVFHSSALKISRVSLSTLSQTRSRTTVTIGFLDQRSSRMMT